jgi:hypothetical protein
MAQSPRDAEDSGPPCSKFTLLLKSGWVNADRHPNFVSGSLRFLAQLIGKNWKLDQYLELHGCKIPEFCQRAELLTYNICCRRYYDKFFIDY